MNEDNFQQVNELEAPVNAVGNIENTNVYEYEKCSSNPNHFHEDDLYSINKLAAVSEEVQ